MHHQNTKHTHALTNIGEKSCLTDYCVVVISEMKFTSGLVVIGCALVLFCKWQVKSWLNFGYIYVWYTARWRSSGSRWKAWSWFWHGNGWSQGCGRVNKVPLPHSLPPSLPPYLWCFFHFGLFFFHPDSDPFLPFLISFFCHRRSNILGVRVKREFGENETKVQVFCIFFCISLL